MSTRFKYGRGLRDPTPMRHRQNLRLFGITGYQVRPTIYTKTKWHRGPRGWKHHFSTL
jgi:hypothetical protein